MAKPVTIRCKIERPGGSHVSLDGKTYHFEPRQKDGPHLCDVTDPSHVSRLLSIVEGYEFAGSAGEREPLVVTESADAMLQKAAAGEAAIQNVLADPGGVDSDTIVEAFIALNGRVPNPQAPRKTVVQRIIQKATEQGFVVDEDADRLIEQLSAEDTEPDTKAAAPAEPTKAADTTEPTKAAKSSK